MRVATDSFAHALRVHVHNGDALVRRCGRQQRHSDEPSRGEHYGVRALRVLRAPVAPLAPPGAESSWRRSARSGGRCGARDGVEACGEVVGGRGGRAVWARRQEGPALGSAASERYGTAGEARG